VRGAALLFLLVLLAGCDESLDKQNRFKTYGAAGLNNWPSDSEALQRVPGTVAQGDVEREHEIAQRPAMSWALMVRGRERYDIYCAPCHGLTGTGDGIVVARGFPHPTPFSDPSILADPAKRLVSVIGYGTGTMYGFYDRIDPKDRWAIAAYIRALQLADSRKAKP
jgi:mono/diheme cytochrome c family protein